MLLLVCPWCGPRAQSEFTYGGDATIAATVRPAGGLAAASGWTTCTFVRTRAARTWSGGTTPRDAGAGSR